jgi:hypothetical protein
VHKLDISGMETDSAFVVLGEDGSQVRPAPIPVRSSSFDPCVHRLQALLSPVCSSALQLRRLTQPQLFGCFLSATTAQKLSKP